MATGGVPGKADGAEFLNENPPLSMTDSFLPTLEFSYIREGGARTLSYVVRHIWSVKQASPYKES